MSIAYIIHALVSERESNHHLGLELIKGCKQRIDWHNSQIELHRSQITTEEAAIKTLSAEIEARDNALGLILQGPDDGEKSAP